MFFLQNLTQFSNGKATEEKKFICNKAQDNHLIKIGSWITSNLNLVLSTESASQGSSEVMVELLSKSIWHQLAN